MALTKAQKQQRRSLTEAYEAANPAAGHETAAAWGKARYREILEDAQRAAQAQRLHEMNVDQFEHEFGARLAEVGSTAGLSSPYWAR